MDGSREERYGAEIISDLSAELTKKYGKGFDRTSLYRYVKFYRLFPEIVATPWQQSDGSESEIVATPWQQSFMASAENDAHNHVLSWSHYRVLLQVADENARKWYENEAKSQTWSVKTLQRNISTQYYDRMLLSHDKAAVESEMKSLTSPYQKKLEFIHNPVIAEFLGMQEDTSYMESDLENAIIGNLQKFLMELGKGYAFVARQ